MPTLVVTILAFLGRLSQPSVRRACPMQQSMRARPVAAADLGRTAQPAGEV